MTKRILAIVLGLAMVFSAGSAMAAMDSATGDYSVTLGNVCTIDTTATTANFGFYPLMWGFVGGLPAGSVSVTCTPGVNYLLGAGGGLNPGASMLNPNLPTMADGTGSYVAYMLHDNFVMYGPLGDWNLNMIDPAYVPTHPMGFNGWGVFLGNGAAQTYNLFADVFIDDPFQVAGFYSDTVTFTVVW